MPLLDNSCSKQKQISSMIDLVNKQEKVLTGNDCIVIRKYVDGIEGGRALDVSDFKAVTGTSVLHAGHVIIKKDGVYKPMPVKKSQIAAHDEYVAVEDPTGQNPYSKGWYKEDANEESGYAAVGSSETTPVANTTYYEKVSVEAADAKDSEGNQLYEYDSLPSNYSYAGILVASIDAATHGAGIMTRGKVNKSDDAMPFSITSILSAVKSALPLIEFMEDAD